MNQAIQCKSMLDERDMLHHFNKEAAVPSKRTLHDGLLLCMEHTPNEM